MTCSPSIRPFLPRRCLPIPRKDSFLFQRGAFGKSSVCLTTCNVKTKLLHEFLEFTHRKGFGAMELEDIASLEARIHRLLDQHAKVKREKETVEKRLQERESEFHQLRGRIRHFERERSEILEKLERILGDLGRLDLG